MFKGQDDRSQDGFRSLSAMPSVAIDACAAPKNASLKKHNVSNRHRHTFLTCSMWMERHTEIPIQFSKIDHLYQVAHAPVLLSGLKLTHTRRHLIVCDVIVHEN